MPRDATATREKIVVAAGKLFYGVSLGSVLLLAALGLAITFGLMGIINMAHGELLMIGAYTTYVCQLVFRRFFPGALDAYLVVALPAAFIVAAAVGIALERLVSDLRSELSALRLGQGPDPHSEPPPPHY